VNKEDLTDAFDYITFPLMFPYSAYTTVDSYLSGQFSEIVERKWRYIPDTLAQLPLLGR
jgi:hypothetical protein